MAFRFLALACFLAFFLPASAQPVLGPWVAPDARLVTFQFPADQVKGRVVVAGFFNAWSQTANPLAPGKTPTDPWTVTLRLPAPADHDYKFVVGDGEWVFDPGSPLQSPDGAGFANSRLTLAARGASEPIDEAAGKDYPLAVAPPPPAADQPAFPPPDLANTVKNLPRGPGAPLSTILLATTMLAFAIVATIAWEFRTPTLGRRLCVVIPVMVLAFGAREGRWLRSGEDMDEGVYIPVAESLRGRFLAPWTFADETGVLEHPRAGFMLHAASLAVTFPFRERMNPLQRARFGAVVLAVILAGILAWRWPVAGTAWAFHGLGIHYSAIAYLDGPMACWAVVTMIGLALSREGDGTNPRDGLYRLPWLALSAVAAGLLVATKYLGAPIPIVVAGVFMFDAFRANTMPAQRRILGLFAAYVAIAVGVMVIADVSLWTREILDRILFRLRFHQEYSHGGLVTDIAFPWYQQLVWGWKADTVAALTSWPLLDRCVLVLGLAGFALAPWRSWWVGAAGFAALAFLFYWNTKWPQYFLLLLPFLCLGINEVVAFVGGWVARRFGWFAPPAPSAQA